MMRRQLGAGIVVTACAVLACVAAIASGQAAERTVPRKPQRIMSVNMCSDILLLMLVPKDRIASITYLAHDPVEVLMPGADAGVPVNRGTAEEVVRQQPDLILASPWSTPVLRRLAAEVGAPLKSCWPPVPMRSCGAKIASTVPHCGMRFRSIQ